MLSVGLIGTFDFNSLEESLVTVYQPDAIKRSFEVFSKKTDAFVIGFVVCRNGIQPKPDHSLAKSRSRWSSGHSVLLGVRAPGFFPAIGKAVAFSFFH